VGSLLALVVLALVVIPLVFEDRVANLLRNELNERLDATVELRDIDLSLLTSFPTLTAEIRDLVITGKGEFEGEKLLSVRSVGVGVDLFELIGGEDLVVESISIDQPEVHVRVTKDGTASYDIVASTETEEPASEETAGSELAFRIEEYRIRDGELSYDEPGVHVVASGLEHDGSAAIDDARQDLDSETTIDELTVELGRVTYVRKARLAVVIDAVVDTEQQRVDLGLLRIELNRLAVEGSGDIGWKDDTVSLDVAVASDPAQSIKALVSAIPNALISDFDDIEAGGSFSAKASVDGTLGPGDDDIPAFQASLTVRNGTLQYPDLPLPLSKIALDAAANHPGGNLDKMRLAVSKLEAHAGKSYAKGSLKVTRPLSRPDLDLMLDGRFDTAEIAKAYPMEDVEDLRGTVVTNIALQTAGENIERLEGSISVSDVLYRAKDTPEVKVPKAQLTLGPKRTTIDAFDAVLGRSEISLKGSVSPLLSLLEEDETIEGDLKLSSRAIYVDDFLTEGDETTEDAPFLIPSNVDAKLSVDVAKLVYGELELKNLRGAARVRDRKLILSGVRADALGGVMKLSGVVATPEAAPSTFDMEYTVDQVSFAQAFEALPSMRAFAPIARFLDGRFSTDLEASGRLGESGEPKLGTIDANGLVMTLQSKLGPEFKPLAALSKAVPAIPRPLDLRAFRTRFAIEDGRVQVKPFIVDAGNLDLNVSGTHGLDQEMSYRVSTDIPIDRVTGAIEQSIRKLGTDLTKVEDVAVIAKVTGSIDDPRVSVDVDTEALRGAVADTVARELEEKRKAALAELSKQTSKIIEEAEKRAAQIRKESRKAADKVRDEAYKRADQLVEEAGSNPLKKVAAKEAAKRIRSEADKRSKQLVREADERAEGIVEEAKQRVDRLEEEAKAKSGQGIDEATKPIR